MSNGRRATRPVRQLSLQQPTPRRQHIIRRQRSAEDDCNKSLQIYANPIARDRRLASTNATEKPKVRVAWGDDHRGCDGLAQVEVVARQIPGRSRPTTGRSTRSYASAEKASILYSRQELAERLRLAWKHREQNKANIDIFLAHGVATEERCDSELSMSVPPMPLAKEETDSVCVKKRGPRNLGASRNQDRERKMREIDNGVEGGCGKKVEIASPMNENDLLKGDEDTAESVKEGRGNEGMTISHPNPDGEEKKKKTRINIDCTNLHPPTSNQLQSSIILPSLKSENANLTTTTNDDLSSSAKQKRASFHSGTNRAFLVPMVEKSPKRIVEAKDKLVPAKSVEIRCASADKTAMRSPIDKTILANNTSAINSEKAKRTNSAPPQRRNVASATRVQVNIVIDAPGITEVTNNKSIACDKTHQDGKDAAEKSEENSMKILRGERSIRSASLKKRSKSSKRRLLASSGCKDEDRGGRGKNIVDLRTSDVVTMVSLISSADSDSDVENSPGDDKLISELRSKLPTTSIIKTSINPNPNTSRKPIKSVSFQRDSLDEEPTKDEKRIVSNVQPPRYGFAIDVVHRNDGEDLTEQDLDVDGVVLTAQVAVSTLISQDTEKEMPETPLTDREKRCLAVPIGDLHDKKRKLLRTRSTPNRPMIVEQMNRTPMEIKEQRPPLAMSRVDLIAIQTPPIDTPLPKIEQFSKEILPTKETPRNVTLSSEPHFQTIKEKECWHLYRRMCDKGVCVSFDTVLRGMLTPTEYRLRQKEFSQDLR